MKTDFSRETEYLGLSLTQEQAAQFEKYFKMLVKRNESVNLTAITDRDEVYEKHFLDSLSIVNAVDMHGVSSVIDIGTGAGFPGLPLKIMFPEIQIVLADALQKRVDFLNDVIAELGLSGITAVHARAEELGQNPDHREKYDMCVSRAVAALPLLCEYCLPLVRCGGIFAAYKAVSAKEELEAAANAIGILGGNAGKLFDMTIGPNELSRTIILIDKIKAAPQKYPRAAGKAKKKPL